MIGLGSSHRDDTLSVTRGQEIDHSLSQALQRVLLCLDDALEVGINLSVSGWHRGGRSLCSRLNGCGCRCVSVGRVGAGGMTVDRR